MGANNNQDATNTSALPSFSALKGHERRAVILKAEGKTNGQIAAHINNEFILDYADRTVQEWFVANGRLYQAMTEYNEAQAIISLQQARQLIKKSSSAAAATLIRQLNSIDEKVAQGAAWRLLNKYIPDKQVVFTDSPEDEELPDELAAVADSLREDGDGSTPVDDASVGGQDTQTPGS